MTNYTKEISEQIGAREADTDIIVSKTSIWEKVITPIHLPSNKHLVGHWSFNEGPGMIAHDRSIYGNHGTLVNMEEEDWVDGKVGKALDYDGLDDHVDVSSIPLYGDVSHSIVAWIYIDAIRPTRSGILILKPQDLGGHHFLISSNETVLQVGHWGGGNVLTSAVGTGSLVHVVSTFDQPSRVLKVYINGNLDKQKTLTSEQIFALDGGLILGDGVLAELNFDGKIDEVRIYKRALTATEVKALYLFPSGPTIWADNKIIQEQENE